LLTKAVANLPHIKDKNLLVGFDTSDDGAVYQLNDDIAVIQTLDFFPPMVSDPYVFGQIAAANSLSDVYAMGGVPKTALNIVCFPESEDAEHLSEILRGGAEKVMEAGAVLCGGHSVNDKAIKYGLSVTGVVHPDKILQNNTCKIGDKIILTKPLGIGIVSSAYNAGVATEESFLKAVECMRTLNKYAFDVASKYSLNACTDVTGFGFLGHLNEMVGKDYSIKVDSKKVPFISEALKLAEEFLVTAGGQKNRIYLIDQVYFENVSDAMQEILFDPQTSGGLLFSVSEKDSNELIKELKKLALPCEIVGEVVERKEKNILVI